jgi:aminopeptidase YwaD
LTEITPRLDEQRLWRHLRELCEVIGPRLSGTPGDERAVEYIAGQFRRCGAGVVIQDYPCPSWEHEVTELALILPTGATVLQAVAQTFTEGCDVEAPLIGVGSLEELEFAPGLEGKVLVLHSKAAVGLNVDRNYKLLSAEERRPAALIVVSPVETVSTKLLRDPFLRVPGVAVSRSVGGHLLAHAGRSLRLRLRARRYPSTGHNVLGRLSGDEAERVVVAAHYDTAADVSGATDNASGTAALLALCESFATSRRRLTIDFVAYGAEEYGRHGGNLGAVEYVRQNPDDVATARALVELDCIGTVAGPLRAIVLAWPAGRPLAMKAALLEVLQGISGCVLNDRSEDPGVRTAFYLPGVPSIAFNDDYSRLPIHTAQDTIDLMRPEALVHATASAVATIQHLLL